MYICIYVCFYIYICVCVCLCAHACIRLFTYTDLSYQNICTYTFAYAHIHNLTIQVVPIWKSSPHIFHIESVHLPPVHSPQSFAGGYTFLASDIAKFSCQSGNPPLQSQMPGFPVAFHCSARFPQDLRSLFELDAKSWDLVKGQRDARLFLPACS